MTREEAKEILIPFQKCMFDQHGCPISDVAIALDVAIAALEQPERKKGRWVYLSSVHGIDTSTRTYSYPFCSECGREHPVANFCSNCGADMREEGEQE